MTANLQKMIIILFFFGKQVCHVYFSSDVFDYNEIVLDIFAYRVFASLYMPQTFGGCITRPHHTGLIVVVNGSWCRHKDFVKIEVFKNNIEVL